MSKRCTIHTVARAAKVSVATVSRVVNNPSLVSADKRWRVMEVMQHHNFWVSRRRRSSEEKGGVGAVSKGALRVGFLAPDPLHRNVEVLTEEMLRGAQKVLARRGAELIIDHFSLDLKKGDPLPKFMADRSIKGFLLRPPSDPEAMEALAEGHKVVVMSNTHSGSEIPCVMADNLFGMRLVMDHLFELGHRRIAFVSGPLSSLLNQQRQQAYRLALLQRGLAVDERLIKVDPNWILNQEQSHRDCLRFWEELFSVEDPPTAIAAAMDGFAAQMIRIASEKGVSVPSQISITGFGDLQYTAFTDPPITTVRVDHRAIGELGALTLMGLIEGASAPSQVVIRPSLVVRRSTAKRG